MTTSQEITSHEYWDDVYTAPPRPRLPSSLNVSTRNIQRLLRAYIKPGQSILEIGCAPGKILVWTAKVLGAKISGLDYSQRGIEFTRDLMSALEADCDLRRENIYHTTFQPETFDFVYSLGFIEHFNSPAEIVKHHVELLRAGGVALITIPNYAPSHTYGRLIRYFDDSCLPYHNLEIMNFESLAALAPVDLAASVRTFPIGTIDPWPLNIHKRWSKSASNAFCLTLNALGLVQPFKINALCPWLALEIVKL